MGQRLAPCEELVAASDLPPELRTDGWEVGRLVLAPEYRSNAEILKTCLSQTFREFLAVTPRANAFATCTPLLSRLYRRYGFTVVVKDAVQTDGETYAMIHGTVESVRQAILDAEPPILLPPAPRPMARALHATHQGAAA